MLGGVIAKALCATGGTASCRAVSGSIVTSRISATRHLLSVKLDTEFARPCPGPDAARSAAPALGLSKDKIASFFSFLRSAREGRASVVSYSDGSLVSFQRESGRVEQSKSKPRGAVCRGFSARSRARMIRLLGMLRRDALPVFVTLTYPRVWSSDYRQWKRNLDAFGHWLRRWSLQQVGRPARKRPFRPEELGPKPARA
jgi:hypothetical protein